MMSLGFLIVAILNLLMWAIIIAAVMSWLIVFDVINTRNKFVYGVYSFLQKLMDPLLSPIRRFIPLIGGVDLSPLILIFLIIFLTNLIHEYWIG